MATPSAETVTPTSAQGLARALLALAKPRVTALVAATALAGVLVDHRPDARAWTAALATTLLVASANVLNCWLERDVDALMTRTRTRPLPAGTVTPAVALAWGLLLAAVSIPALATSAGGPAATLGALALVLYVLVYTPLKRVTPLALYVGAVPGALPPVLGRLAVTHALDGWCLVLFGVVYLWQVPHFVAIALARKEDYARAGLAALPVARGDAGAMRHAIAATVLLAVVSVLPVATGAAGVFYGLVATAAAAVMLAAAWPSPTPRASARRLLLSSLGYLPVVLGALVLDRALR